MKYLPVYIPGWLVLISFSLPVSSFGDRIYFPTKSDIACRMVEDSPCNGAFLRRIATTCEHQWLSKNLRIEKGQHSLSHSTTETLMSNTAHALTSGIAERSPGVKTAGPSHGIVCQRLHDCRIKKSHCYSGICLCTLGLYFSPKQNACLRACAEYGDEFDIYKGAGIKGNNDRELHTDTLTGCFEFCLRETTFTCLTVEWSTDSSCFLSTKGYRDVAFFFRERGARDFTFGQRRCK